MKIIKYFTLALLALISAFLILTSSIFLGIVFSALGTFSPYGTTLHKFLTMFGYALSALAFAIPVYFLVTRTRLNSVWFFLFLIIPIILFNLYIALSSPQLDMGSYAQAAVWCTAGLCIFRKSSLGTKQ